MDKSQVLNSFHSCGNTFFLGVPVWLVTPLSSQERWPKYKTTDDEDDHVQPVGIAQLVEHVPTVA